MKPSLRLKNLRWKLVWLGAIILLAITTSNWWIVRAAEDRVFSNLAALPANEVALVLGASARTAGGHANPHFQSRLKAAAELYHSGKVKHLLLSGDNHTVGYDEPADMKDGLLKRGVPRSAMTLDYAGFRTLDSLARAKAVFNLNRLTIVTDDFHAHRALFLSRSHGIEAVVFYPQPVPMKYSGKTRLREYFARVKALLDVYVLRTKPKFYGPKIEIVIDPYES